MSQINILEAFHGDCLFIKTFDKKGASYNILVDGGPSKTFPYSLKKELSSIKTINLLILTHIDNDHIKGLLSFFKNSLFKKINILQYWFNGGNLAKIRKGNQVGFSEGIEFEKYLLEIEGVKKWNFEPVYTKQKITIADGINIQILSPTPKTLKTLFEQWKQLKNINNYIKEAQIGFSTPKKHPKLNDNLKKLAEEKFKPSSSKQDIINNSSIAFILKTPHFSGLFLGDSRPETIIKSLDGLGFSSTKKVKVDIVKVSHHGSKNNTSNELLDMIKCEHFIISTNGGTGRAKHPNRETIARILCHPKRNYKIKRTIYFNYSKEVLEKRIGKFINDTEEINERTIYNFETKFATKKISFKK